MYFHLTDNLQHANLEWSLFPHFRFQGPWRSIKLCLYLYECSYFISKKCLEYNVKGQVYKAFLMAFQEGWGLFGGGERERDGTEKGVFKC